MRYFTSLLGILCLAIVSVTHAATRCPETSGLFGTITITCTPSTRQVTGHAGDTREVKYLLPDSASLPQPAAGWPVVVMYHGTGGLISFKAPSTSTGAATFGNYYQVQAVRDLVDHGYAVIAPPAKSVTTAWETNDAPKPTPESYPGTDDYAFLSAVFAQIADGSFGPLDSTQMHATGISSGGYNTSRMAVNFSGVFRSLAIVSASYATCSGYPCTIPALPIHHEPTLFVHGTADALVPISTMRNYYDALELLHPGANRKVEVQGAGHQWTAPYPGELLNWVMSHP